MEKNNKRAANYIYYLINNRLIENELHELHELQAFIWVRSADPKYFQYKFRSLIGKCSIFGKFRCAIERSTLPRVRGSLRAR